MKKILFVILILSGLCTSAQTKNAELDSIYEQYLLLKSDTAKLRILNILSHQMLQKDKALSINLARKALFLVQTSKSKPAKATAIYNYAYILRYAQKADSSLMLLKQSKVLFEKLKDTTSLAFVYTQLAAHSNDKGDNQRCIELMDTSAIYFEKVNDMEKASRSLGILGSLYSVKNDYQSALGAGTRALNIANKLKDSIAIGRALLTLAGTYRELQNFPISKSLYFEAININSRHGDKVTQFLGYKNMAALFNESGRHDSSLWAINSALVFLDTNSRPSFYAAILISKASTYLQLGDLEEGKKNLDKAYQISKTKNYESNFPNIYQYYGSYYREKGNYTRSKEYFLKGLNLVKKQSKFQSFKFYYMALEDIASKQGDFKEALKYNKLLVEYNDSVYKIDRTIAISNAETQFGVEKKNLQIAILKREAELKERKSSKQRLLIIGAFSLAILLGFLGFFGIRQNRLNQKLKMERFRNKVASDLHDDVGSTLSSIAMYSEVIKKKAQHKIPEAVPMLENMSRGSKEIMDAMSDIVWTINPKNNTIQSLLTRINELSSQICEAKNIDFIYEGDPVEGIKLDMPTAQNIYLVLKESINNALKYSECSKIKLQTISTSNSFKFIVSDNGKGFDLNINSQGNGLLTMKQRMDEAKGKFSISSNENGTILEGSVII